MKCKKVFENWCRNELTESILAYYNGNSNLSSVRLTVRHTKSNQSKRSLTGHLTEYSDFFRFFFFRFCQTIRKQHKYGTGLQIIAEDSKVGHFGTFFFRLLHGINQLSIFFSLMAEKRCKKHI